MRVVVFQMSFNRSPQIAVGEVSQNGNPLVDVNIVKHEIREAIKQNSDTETKQVMVRIHDSEIDQKDAWNGKDNGKNVVPFNFESTESRASRIYV